jgi:hypothetical protein
MPTKRSLKKTPEIYTGILCGVIGTAGGVTWFWVYYFAVMKGHTIPHLGHLFLAGSSSVFLSILIGYYATRLLDHMKVPKKGQPESTKHESVPLEETDFRKGRRN